MIRGIRVISGQLNIIHTRIYFFRTRIKRIKRILQVRFTCFPKNYIYMYARQQHITRQSESQQPQAVTLANPFRIPLHRKRKVKKKIRGQRLRVHPFNPWAFFWPESCGRRLTGELWHDIPYSSTSKIKKKVFFLFLPSHPHFPSETPCLSGFQWWG